MNDKKNDKRRESDERSDSGVERGYANRHAEITEPGQVRRQEIPPEIEGDAEEVEQEADRRRNEGVERGYANRHAEVAGAVADEPLAPAPFTRPRTTAEPEGGYEEGYPRVYFSVYDRVPPIVVKTPNEEAAIDKANFMTIPPEEVDPALTDAKMRAEWRVGDRAAERNLEQTESRSAFSPVAGESERRNRPRDEERERKAADDRKRAR
jgi:hypothetical protein